MKNSSKKTNKQNTARSTQNTARKLSRKTKDERRVILFSKKHVKLEHRRAVYGADGGAAYALARGTDLNRRFIAAFMVLVFALTTMVIGVNIATKADDPNTVATDPLKPAGEKGKKSDTSDMVLNKYLTPNGNGNYDLTLEAYSTAEVKPIEEKIPTDFVVVVDQSGSMDTQDMPTGTPTVQNNKYLEDIANGAYFYKDGDNYYRVYGVKDYLYRYYPANYWFTGDIVEHLGTDIGWFMGETDATTDIDNAFYFSEVVNGTTYYIPIRTTIQGKIGTYYMRFSYPSKKTGSTYEFNREVTTYSSNGNSPWYKNVLNGDVMTSGATWSAANAAVQTLYPNDNAYTYSTIKLLLARPRTGMYINYPMYGRHLSYTKLCYRDVNGVEHTLPSNQSGQTVWEYCDDDGVARTTDSVTSARPTYSGLYTFPTTSTRISALKAALNQFAQAVADEEDDFGAVDNRISIVGFSSSGYNNTELLTHTERNITGTSTNGWQKDTCDGDASEYYGKGLVDSTNGTVGTINPKITRAITAITANGGTQPEDGLNMAYKILTNRGEKTTYTIRSGANKDQVINRNTVVIFFTDGQPGDYHYSDQYTEANEVIAQAKQIKDYGKTLNPGTSIFSIGVFGESDANPLTYTHETRTDYEGENKAWKYLGGWMESYHDSYYPYNWYCLRRQWRPNSSDGYTNTPNDTIFDYMSVVSSNYPDAKNYIAPAWLDGNFSGNYIDATEGDAVRQKSTAVRDPNTNEYENRYYRMASNQDTLVAAFLQAVTMNNEESSHDSIPADSIVLKDAISDSFSVKLNSENEPTIKYYTQQGKMVDGIVNFTGDPDEIENPGGGFNGDNLLTVTNFDFSGEYIASDHVGHKLIVVIKDVIPNSDVTSENSTLFSNQDGAGINIIGEDDSEDSIGEFPKPYISRHSYTLDVSGDDESKASFKVLPSLINGISDLNDVILVYPNAEGELTRVKYLDYLNQPTKEFDMKDNQKFYFENVPDDYKVKTSVTAQDNRYTYTMYANDDTGNTSELRTDVATDRTLNYEDSILHITSVANTRSVTIRETVDGSFANNNDEFTPTLCLVPPTGQQVPEGGATYDGVKWDKDGTNNCLRYTPQQGIRGNNTDSISLTVPANWKLIVEQTDDNYYEVTAKKYVLGTSGTSTVIPPAGVEITDNLTITITNTRDNIPVTGVNDSSNHNWLIYILAALGGLAAIGAGIFLWKKKDEFVEQ